MLLCKFQDFVNLNLNFENVCEMNIAQFKLIQSQMNLNYLFQKEVFIELKNLQNLASEHKLNEIAEKISNINIENLLLKDVYFAITDLIMKFRMHNCEKAQIWFDFDRYLGNLFTMQNEILKSTNQRLIECEHHDGQFWVFIGDKLKECL